MQCGSNHDLRALSHDRLPCPRRGAMPPPSTASAPVLPRCSAARRGPSANSTRQFQQRFLQTTSSAGRASSAKCGAPQIWSLTIDGVAEVSVAGPRPGEGGLRPTGCRDRRAIRTLRRASSCFRSACARPKRRCARPGADIVRRSGICQGRDRPGAGELARRRSVLVRSPHDSRQEHLDLQARAADVEECAGKTRGGWSHRRCHQPERSLSDAQR